LSWYNATARMREGCVQKDKRSATARMVESFDKSQDAESRAAQLNSTDTKEGRKDE